MNYKNEPEVLKFPPKTNDVGQNTIIKTETDEPV